jgi:predicted RNase H-like HicB family nuclease
MQKRHSKNRQIQKCEIDLKLTPEIHREGEWYVAFCPEVPEANGQGRTREECVQSLKEAVLLLMEDRREDALRKPSVAVQTLEPA